VSGLRDGAELRVTRGRGTAEELVGVLFALDDRVAAEDVDAAEPAPSTGWTLAARLEAIGAGRYAAAADLAVLRRR